MTIIKKSIWLIVFISISTNFLSAQETTDSRFTLTQLIDNALQQLESHLKYSKNLFDIGKVSKVDVLKIKEKVISESLYKILFL